MPQAWLGIKRLNGFTSRFTKCVTLPKELSLPGVKSNRLRRVVVNESNHWVAKLHRGSHRPHHRHSKVNSDKLRQTFFFFSPMPGQRHLTIPVTSAVPPSLAVVPATVSVLTLLLEDPLNEKALPGRREVVDCQQDTERGGGLLQTHDTALRLSVGTAAGVPHGHHTS